LGAQKMWDEMPWSHEPRDEGPEPGEGEAVSQGFVANAPRDTQKATHATKGTGELSWGKKFSKVWGTYKKPNHRRGFEGKGTTR